MANHTSKWICFVDLHPRGRSGRIHKITYSFACEWAQCLTTLRLWHPRFPWTWPETFPLLLVPRMGLAVIRDMLALLKRSPRCRWISSMRWVAFPRNRARTWSHAVWSSSECTPVLPNFAYGTYILDILPSSPSGCAQSFENNAGFTEDSPAASCPWSMAQLSCRHPRIACLSPWFEWDTIRQFGVW